MNRILPSQANWPPQTSYTASRQKEDFAEKLQAKPQHESGRAIVDQAAATKDSTATTRQVENLGSPVEEGEDSMAAAGTNVPSLESDGAGVSEGLGSTLAAQTALDGTSTPSIGLLSGTLTWSRVYPEHLIASGYLSMVDTAAHDGDVPSEAAWVGPDTNIPSSGMSTATPTVALDPDGAGAMAKSPFDASHQPIANAGTVTWTDPDSEAASSARQLDAAVLADHFWAERLMRLTRDGDGHSTVWLRDYRLKANDFGPVVAKLRWHGQREGVPIDRVVINGREVWRAAASKGEH